MNINDSWQTEKRYMIVKSLLTGECRHSSEAFDELGFGTVPMLVVCAESFDKEKKVPDSFHKLMLYGGSDAESIICFDENGREILLLMGRKALDRFNSIIYHFKYHNPQGSSPLGHFFITYGQTAKNAAGIAESYNIAMFLMDNRFYFRNDEHICGPERMPVSDRMTDTENSSDLAESLIGPLTASNKPLLTEKIKNVENEIINSGMRPDAARSFITGIYVRTAIALQKKYREKDLMPREDATLALLQASSLSESMDILQAELFFLLKEFDSGSGHGIINDLKTYVEHNYHLDLRLAKIAPEFGYNSAYLGRIFSERTGETFNSYVDRVRMEKACELLTETGLKVYEVAEHVGYKNVDYFHIKFHKATGLSPAEYKKGL